MYENNYSKKIDYPDLTADENKILAEMNAILDLDNREGAVEIYEKRQPLIRNFIVKFESKGLVLNNYILGRRLKWSTPQEGKIELDTPDQEIQKFIITLEKIK